jgi:gliding motility-associated-like protein
LFSDATTQLKTDANPFQKTFSPAGNYNAQLLVSTDSGCKSNTFSRNFKVNPLPVADFDLPANACVNTPAVFADKSTIADNSQSQFAYSWKFGNAGTSGLKNPGFSFPASGNYDIKLQVTSKDGCMSTLTKTLVNVLPQPVANFSMTGQQACINDTISFTDLSNPLSQTINSWNWEFGDGNKMNGRNVAYSWLNQGNYNVSHYYVTSIGCNSDTIVKAVSVYPVPGVNAGPDIFILQGGQKTLQASVTGGSGYQYLWTPSTGLDNPNILQPVASSPVTEITYTLTVTAAGGCSATDEMIVKRLENPIIPNAFSPNNDGINDTWMIRYIDSYAESTINIFDRYGRQVFAGKGSSRPWDGTQNGRPVPVGVYYYIIDLKIGKPPVTGSVTIIR